MKWMDKKEVYMITPVHEISFCVTGKKHWKTGKNIMKPVCVHEYNKNMGGIDNIDRQLSLTETARKSMKWYRKIFFNLLDLILANAHILYKMNTKEDISFPELRLRVVRGLLKFDTHEYLTSIESSAFRLSGRHFPRPIHKEDQEIAAPMCVVRND